MVAIIDGKLAPTRNLPDRATARTSHLPKYEDDDHPCPKHGVTARYTCNDQCVICWNTSDRRAR